MSNPVISSGHTARLVSERCKPILQHFWIGPTILAIGPRCPCQAVLRNRLVAACRDWSLATRATARCSIQHQAALYYPCQKEQRVCGNSRPSNTLSGEHHSSFSMEEQQVGIEEYCTTTTGFTGILKHRYNDFQVSEVDLAGRIAHLTSISAPHQDEPAMAAGLSLTPEAIKEVSAAFAAIAGQGNADRLLKLLETMLQQQNSSRPEQPAAADPAQQEQPQQQQQQQVELEIDLLPVEDKESRKAMHQFLKSDPRLPALETDTVASEAVAEDGQAIHNVIRIRPATKAAVQGGGRQRGQQGGKKGNKRAWRDEPNWEGGANKHVKFVMLKENMDTQAALTIISRMLHCHMKNFGFAGTKDKRGVTAQFVTIWRTPTARLAALNPRLRGIMLGDFEYASSHLQLGQLKGNHFKILMRDVSSTDEQHIAACVSEVSEKGFINYFGLQRFGTGSVPTHRVGAALLRGEWQAAVQLIMQGGEGERQEFREARALYTDKGDIQGALKALPGFLVAERAILQALAKSGANSYLSALQAIPRTLRSMYMHAWQSLVWNRAASERIRRYGSDRVLAGDLVLLLPEQQQQQGGNAAAQQNPASADQQMQPAEDAIADEVDAAAAASAAGRLAAVHVVTAEEVAAGRFTIQDVVLPLPGARVQYPKHEAGWKLYCSLAAENRVMLPGMTQEDLAGSGSTEAGVAAAAASHNARDFQLAGLTGDYRKLLHVPSDLTHKVIRYTNPNQDDLLPSHWRDLQDGQEPQQKRQKQSEQLQQAEQQDDAGVSDDEATAEEVKGTVESSSRDDLCGVVLEFTLPPSCYATMLIRELTKSSTSKASHREMSTRG